MGAREPYGELRVPQQIMKYAKKIYNLIIIIFIYCKTCFHNGLLGLPSINIISVDRLLFLTNQQENNLFGSLG